MTRLSLRARVALVVGLPALAVLAALYWSAAKFGDVSARVGEHVRSTADQICRVDTLAELLEAEDDQLDELRLAGSTTARSQVATHRQRFDRTLAELMPLLDTDEARTFAASLERDVAAFRKSGDAVIAETVPARANAIYAAEVLPALRVALADIAHLRRDDLSQNQTVTLWAHEESRRAMWATTVVTAIALALFGVGTVWLERRIIKPIRDLTKGVETLASGNFERRVGVRSDDEIGTLVTGFNRMAERLGVFHDAKIDEVLRANATLEATLGALPDGVLVVDETGIVVMSNPVADKALGPCVGRALTEIELPTDARTPLAQVVSHGEPVDLARAVAIHGRKLLPRSVSVDATRRLLVLYDVTDVARLDERRVEHLAVASHELQTPLTTLRMTLAMLDDAASAMTPREREMVQTALLGCDQLSATIAEFLDLARVEAGQLQLRMSRVELRDLVRDAVERTKVQASEHNIALEADVVGRSHPILGDRPRLAAVLDNLLSNAIKYTPYGGRVRVELASTPSRTTLAVTDSGPGVPEAFRASIFEKFFRVEHQSGGVEGPQGAGIGLFLAREIVVAHGGTIHCEPGPNGAGARLVIELVAG